MTNNKSDAPYMDVNRFSVNADDPASPEKVQDEDAAFFA